MLKTKVKAGAIANLTDARYFAAWEVEWLGFQLDPSAEAYLSPYEFRAIREWVEGPRVVGEFNLQSAEEIRSLIDNLQLDGIQLGMLTDLETLVDIESPVPVIKELIADPQTDSDALASTLEDFAPHVQFFALNFEKNGYSWEDIRNGRPVSAAWLKDICSRFPILLSLANLENDIESVLRELQPAGISVIGGEEEKVGYKSFDELDELLEHLRVEE